MRFEKCQEATEIWKKLGKNMFVSVALQWQNTEFKELVAELPLTITLPRMALSHLENNVLKIKWYSEHGPDNDIMSSVARIHQTCIFHSCSTSQVVCQQPPFSFQALNLFSWVFLAMPLTKRGNNLLTQWHLISYDTLSSLSLNLQNRTLFCLLFCEKIILTQFLD